MEEAMKEVKLKNCPFCGRGAEVHEDQDWDCHKPEKPYNVRCLGGYAYIREPGTVGCSAETLYFATAEEAIAAWNRRVKP
jgi:hypothetical protein